jgi:hypothetical protein
MEGHGCAFSSEANIHAGATVIGVVWLMVNRVSDYAWFLVAYL